MYKFCKNYALPLLLFAFIFALPGVNGLSIFSSLSIFGHPITSCMLGVHRVYGTPLTIDPNEGIDVVLVIDTSGSMRDTDPERIALEAATLFMDMMETRNSRIGIVGFSSDVHAVMPLTPIYDPHMRENIRHTVSQFEYQGWTDLGLAMRTAVEMVMDDPIQSNSPMILLFTDGRIELPAWFQRNVDVSYQDALWAIENSINLVPIHTIGLNYDNTVNIDFLSQVSSRTMGESFVIEDAALLPELFHQIFANHIRSSIYEVATIFADGDTVSDVIIPISSHFVQEANIIMLSSRPITTVRLFDSLGREVAFDNVRYTLTAANRYSMIKILEPEMGDWLLRVRGLPEDRITVNLIYNYVIDIAFSILQPGLTGAYFDPTEPVNIQAHFVSELSEAQVLGLFEESLAEIYVMDLGGNTLKTIPMEYNGAVFAGQIGAFLGQNVQINIQVTHPSFNLVSTNVTIQYDMEILENLAQAAAAGELPPDTPTEPTLAPTEAYLTPDPSTEPSLAEEDPTPLEMATADQAMQTTAPTADSESASGVLLAILLVLLALVLAAIAGVLFVKKNTARKTFTGHLEVRALLKSGVYTALEAPDLSTFAGRLSLVEFLKVTLGAKAAKILQVNVPLKGTYIEPGIINNQPGVILTTDGACRITDIERNAIHQRKISWEKNQRLTFSTQEGQEGIEKIEITYRNTEG